MSEIQPQVTSYRCAGCGKTYDDEEDICPIPHTIGTSAVGPLCPRCHVTALGEKPPHYFRQAELLS